MEEWIDRLIHELEEHPKWSGGLKREAVQKMRQKMTGDMHVEFKPRKTKAQSIKEWQWRRLFTLNSMVLLQLR